MKFTCFVFWMTVAAGALPASSLLAESPAPVAATRALFNPARHMRVSEVKIGMKGYGLSVFKGTKIEKFDVEVISVLHNFNPKYDVVLIKCFGPFLEHTGSIAGMSGSPIYLHDEAGNDRIIGAFAYGWPLTKDPVAGVQPIEYMLQLPTAWPKSAGATQPTTAPADASNEGAAKAAADVPMKWSLAEAGMLPWPGRHSAIAAGLETSKPRSESAMALSGDGDTFPRLQPLTTPIMVSGMSPRLIEAFSPAFRALGFTALQAGGSSPSDDAVQLDPALEPGSVLAVPLLTGDVDMTAIGTCTERIGDQWFGFGHPFNSEGSTALPMGAGSINSVIANLQTSFKLGSMSKSIGTLSTDETVGVAGQTGKVAPTVPIDFAITYADGTPARTYHFQSALHPRFTPLLASMAFSSAITGVSELPPYNTLDYNIDLEFAGGQTLHIANRAVNTNAADLFSEIGQPMTAAAENPFRRVLIRKVSGTVRVSPEALEAQIMDVQVPRAKYRPGETIKAFVTYKPFRAEESILEVEMDVPHDLQQGTYQLVISDAQRYFLDEQQSKPFRFTAEKVEDVFAVLRDVTAIRMNALYLRLVRQPDGVALGRTALPHLPSSRRQILMGAGRSTTTAYVSSDVKVVPTELVMDGSAEFAITIDRSLKVSVGGPRSGAKSEAPGPAPKPDESGKAKSPAPADTPAPKEPAPRQDKPTE